ncbi:acyl-CoA dehydrogenase [Pseudohalioglobus sediminis]|uniref:3-methylmercaptopropionyl-CoA dehydrogenase n=1 Tax=Pseudohalioglobus sediminis TaxID=2606449 RepID=A0A5B0WZR5_9GAMM|nr:acyl-CoA dehydrogenase C-terminal domain-containing protein [Pseudohalioglobus sediminis]KAA1192574.1 acyl-CoA dehydrogenase [Pseudohalioglobus sediminis]
MNYQAPLNDMQFVLLDVLGVGNLSQFDKYTDASPELIVTILDEMGKFSAEVLHPINKAGDQQGCQYDPETHVVTTPEGFKAAYKQFVEAGWTALDAPVEWGGQGLPHVLKFVVDEMVCSTNLSLGMYPGLTHGAISALHAHGADELKETYLAKLVSGEWSGTMCLTEPQCGTDLGLIRTRATPQDDGTYLIEGTKIWITGGEHDLADNIVHLVLAKLPGAPDTTKGISLFLVPKVLPDSGERNPVYCGGLEHKMGIKGSATCVMNFESARGWLVGEANDGMRAMFTMMNEARLMVGMQGLGIAEMAYQESLGFARERLQGRALTGAANPDGPADPIIVHPDVRRMLMRQKVLNEGMRALALFTGHQLDLSVAHPDATVREEADDLVQLLTPVVKAFLTDEGFNNANVGLQVLGGAGFTTDWPLEQLVRDCRIARIYEGTNGIQALDLVGRKLGMAGGRLVVRLFALLKAWAGAESAPYADQLTSSIQALEHATGWIAEQGIPDPDQAAAAASPYLRLVALVMLAYLWSRMAATAQEKLDRGEGNEAMLNGKLVSARYYFEKLLPEAEWLLRDITSGKESMMAMQEEYWAA